jgi:hypothetical protein
LCVSTGSLGFSRLTLALVLLIAQVRILGSRLCKRCDGYNRAHGSLGFSVKQSSTESISLLPSLCSRKNGTTTRYKSERGPCCGDLARIVRDVSNKMNKIDIFLCVTTGMIVIPSSRLPPTRYHKVMPIVALLKHAPTRRPVPFDGRKGVMRTCFDVGVRGVQGQRKKLVFRCVQPRNVPSHPRAAA